MIRINLLPHREEKRALRKKAFYAMLGIGAAAGAAVVLVVGGYNARALSIQSLRNGELQGAIVELDKKIVEISTLRQEIDALKARQQAVEDLQADRNQPVYLMDELVKQTPPGVFLKTVKQEGQKVTLTGSGQSQERVSELLRNLSGNSPWLERPELVEVKAGTIGGKDKASGRAIVEFQLSVMIKRPRDKDENPDGKPGAKPGANPNAAVKS
ncbi:MULTISPECIES: PilN domain-containing protein [unclassified Duganella]|uniref:PilN domain-containing protein n=1 Tax=unclassified Duganella TaxID=2636909 RepID=UPI0006FC2F4A|nr:MULTISPECIES: PilN domain-containing protein [unclassified Duganella]KQV44688.1 fimbrial assembly protein [Duganella sp. Root336D2]KRB83210.1 fimbrial assembly protein [Duganella sp. Root198D2]